MKILHESSTRMEALLTSCFLATVHFKKNGGKRNSWDLANILIIFVFFQFHSVT